MLKMTFTFELDEEQVREIFENYNVKFTKKKVKELKGEMSECEADIQSELEENFVEIVGNWINELFEEEE